MSAEILILGSCNMDLVTRTPRVPVGGETLTATSFTTGCGGKGANQAVACARQSLPKPASPALYRDRAAAQQRSLHGIVVSMAGAVGDDAHGAEMVAGLRANGVGADDVAVREGVSTGVAVILVEEEKGENRILLTPGANNTVEPSLLEARLAGNLLPALLVMQLEIPLNTVLAALATAREKKIPVLWNPAPAVKIPDESYKDLSHLIMNETEAAIMAELDGENEDAASEGILQKVFEKFDALGVQNTIVTLGSKGVCYSLDGGKMEMVAAEKVANVVDTTAAGDTFVGAYAVEVVRCQVEKKTFSAKEAILKANKAAAVTVQRAGAMTSIPWMDEV